MHAYVRDVMTTGVVTVRPDTTYRELAAMFRQHRVSGFPVTAEDGKVIGVVSESDLIALAGGAAPLRAPHGRPGHRGRPDDSPRGDD
jgi:CBS domain-containing protein